MSASSSSSPRPRTRTGASRERVLSVLREAAGPLGVDEIAGRVGLHPNTVRFHLDRLAESGEVLRGTEDRSDPGRPRIDYRAAPEPGAEDRRNYQLLSEILAGFVADRVPDVADASTEAGRAWGRFLAEAPRPFQDVDADVATADLLQILDEVGFDPETPDPGQPDEVRLRHCPFLEVAEEHRDVVCSLHLGLMQGALEEMRAPLDTDELVPFAEPGACIARLRRTEKK